MDGYDLLLSQCTQYNESARIYHAAQLSALEGRLSRLEEATWRAVEVAADQGNMPRCNALLRDLAELRGEANEMWREIERPCPDWSRFYEPAEGNRS
ncbi:hypothetical protein [Streptomyces sp. NPDC001315]|uniref:hypothetical protein n=1 Tax=Streptomyces sp. NPDC001315 TaxID=3364562 RepID=UPI0036AEDD07